ncbi:decaprenyl-diphosphate synthase subunit 2-like [Chelonus insularis]|uniref:decaprenyl-diphosphate synthase subunit 2-like n=1 Tax=Chelonus insularis TaxID=460826 RepID=UPI00158881EC|nr:decaprenyl-diphosphate synthase subunit 2-like [Chelonus insularis]
MSINNSISKITKRTNLLPTVLAHHSKGYHTSIDSNRNPVWSKTVSEAEKIVGYSTSFLNLRGLLSDEIANIAVFLRKLMESNHPLIDIAKNLINNGRVNAQPWGLIVLLISKAAGLSKPNSLEGRETIGILHSQRVLAEVTEIIRAGFSIHKGLINIQTDVYSNTELINMKFGNKVALLSGDHLLANSYSQLAALRNQEVSELMSIAVRDIAQADFVGRRDNQNNIIPSVPPEDKIGYAVREWTLQNTLSVGSLLGKSCQGTLNLGGHNEEIQECGYQFGKHLALAWQTGVDLEPFTKKSSLPIHFNLCSAPVMFQIEHDSAILEEINKGLESIHNIDYLKIYDLTINGPGIERTKELQKHHSQKAIDALNTFQDSNAKTALINIVSAI